MKKPVVAIIGKPNVGKSTLFNRIIREKKSLMDDLPGVTRDRIYGTANYSDREFIIIDTAGLDLASDDEFITNIVDHIKVAIEEADILLLVLDGKGGITTLDYQIIELIRKETKPVFYLVNKIDDSVHEERIYDFYSLGIEKLYPVSAAHGRGISDLIDDLIDFFSKTKYEPDDTGSLPKIAIIGRPNVGKSSFLNKLVGFERSIVSETPGTTRDTIDSVLTYNDKKYLFIDTAGIRKKCKVASRIETFSIIKSLKSIEEADIVLLMVDASAGITDQDIKCAGYAHNSGKGIIFVVNKWDLVEKDNSTIGAYVKIIQERIKYAVYAPIIFVSAKSGQRINKCFEQIDLVLENGKKRLSTPVVNNLLQEIVRAKQPGMSMGSVPKLSYMTQVASTPPTFIIFSNKPEAIHFSYKRYIMNKIREVEEFKGYQIRLIFRLKERSPAHNKEKQK